MQTGAFHTLANSRDRGFIRNWGERERLGMMGLCFVKPQRAAHLVKLLSLSVPRLQFVVCKRPAGCCSIAVDDWGKVLGAVTQQDGAIKFGVTPNIVVVAGIELLSLAVESRISSGRKKPRWNIALGSRASGESRNLAPLSRMRILAPEAANPAAQVAPPIPDPIIRTSVVSGATIAVPSKLEVKGETPSRKSA